MPRPPKSSKSPGHFIGTTSLSHPDIHPDWDPYVEAHLVSFSPTDAPDEITIDTKNEIITPFVLEQIQGFDLGFGEGEILRMREMRERNVNLREDLDLTFIYVGPSGDPKGSLGCPSGRKEGGGEEGKGKGRKREAKEGDGGFNVRWVDEGMNVGGDGGFNVEADGGFNAMQVDGGFNVIQFDGAAKSRKRRHGGDT